MPSQRLQPALQHLLPRRNAVLLAIDVQSFAHRIQALRILNARDPFHSGFSPLFTHIVGRSKRRAIIHHRPAAQTLSCQKSHALILRAGKTAFQIQPLKSCQLRTVKICVVVIVPRLHHEHIFSRSSQLGRRNSSARAGSDHTNIARERSLFLRHNHFQSARGRWPLHSQRPGKSNLLPDAARPAAFRQHHIQKPNCFPQRLKRRSALAQRTIRPGPQHSFARIFFQL